MNDERTYEDWIAWKRKAQPPEGFSETVMSGVRGRPRARRRPSWPAPRLLPKLGLAAAVAAVFLVRLALFVCMPVG